MKGARSVGEYLKGVPADQRRALQKLKRDIKAAAPGAVEAISYGIPAFRYDGKVLAWFHAAKEHCSFFPGAGAIKDHAKALKKYALSKGTVRFDASKPLPAALVRKLVRARMRSIAR